MIIQTKNVNDSNVLFKNVINSSDPYFKCVFLDFENKYIYAVNSIVNMRIKLNFTLEENETLPKNIFVDGSLFLNISKLENEITYKEKDNTFYVNKDKYKLPILNVDTYEFVDFNKVLENNMNLTLNREFCSKLRTSSSFMCQTVYSSREKALNGIFIKDGFVIASDYKKLSFLKITDCNNISIQANILRFITLLENNTINLSYDESCVKIKSSDIELVFSVSRELNLPPIDNEKFISTYEHPNYIMVNREKLLNEISFISNFTTSANSDKVYLKITKDKFNLQVNENDSSVFVDKEFNIEQIETDIDDTTLCLNINDVKLALSSLTTDTVKIKFDNEKIGVKVESDNDFIVLIRRDS